MARTVRNYLLLFAGLLLFAVGADAGLYENWTGTSPLQFMADTGNSNLTGGTTTQYLDVVGQNQTPAAASTNKFWNIAVPGVVRNAWCSVGTALTSTQTYTFTLVLANGTDTAITMPLTSSTTAAGACAAAGYATGQCVVDETHAAGLNRGGQLGYWKVVPTNSAPATPVHCGFQFDPIGGSNPVPQILAFSTGSGNFSATTPFYYPFMGTSAGHSSNSLTNAPSIVPGVFRNLVCTVTTALTGSQTLTATTNATSSLSCLINNTSTCSLLGSSGFNVAGKCCQDTTHTWATTTGDGLGYAVTLTNSPTPSTLACSMEFDPAGGVSPTMLVFTKSADYTILPSDLAQSQTTMFVCDTTSAVRTITLPAANATPWKTVRVKREGASNKCTVSRAGSDTLFDGSAVNTRDLNTNGESIDLTSDGASSWPLH